MSNPTQKYVKVLNRYFMKKDLQVASKGVKSARQSLG